MIGDITVDKLRSIHAKGKGDGADQLRGHRLFETVTEGHVLIPGSFDQYTVERDLTHAYE